LGEAQRGLKLIFKRRFLPFLSRETKLFGNRFPHGGYLERGRNWHLGEIETWGRGGENRGGLGKVKFKEGAPGAGY